MKDSSSTLITIKVALILANYRIMKVLREVTYGTNYEKSSRSIFEKLVVTKAII